MSARLLVLFLAFLLAGGAAAQGKKRIDKAADLPRFSYKLDGRIEDMVRDDAKFKSLATEVRRDLESVLAQYEIEDKATLRQILGELAQLDMLDGSYEAALARVAQIKALEDKPADKLLSGITSRAIAAGVHATPDRSSAAYRAAAAESIKSELAAMPYDVISNQAKEIKAGAELLGEGRLIGNVREVLQPSVDKNGSLSSDLAPAFVRIKYTYRYILPLKSYLKGFSDLQSNIDSPEATEIKSYMSTLKPDEYKAFVEEIGLTGNWMHGTHVAGIAVAGNPYARLVVGRIEFDWHLIPDPCPTRELTLRDAKNAQSYVDFFKQQGVRVVNMSWGGSVKAIEDALELCNIGKTPDERKAIARDYFDIQKDALTKAFASAPEILFVTAAGNSNQNASFVEDIPADIVLPNLLTVGAVDKAGDEASFTSYGPTVKVHANGYQVESVIPGGEKLAESGTSMASPQVVNLAAKILTINPKLMPNQVIALIRDNADKTPDGRRTLINAKKTLAAAQVEKAG